MAHHRKGKPRTDPAIRFAAFISPEPNTGCWLWCGNVSGSGYGAFGFTFTSQKMRAHRYAFEQARGRAVEAGFEIDHTCRNPICVNPDHLEEVTHEENMRRRAAAQTRCKHGHDLTEANTHTDARGWKTCKLCRSAASRRHALGHSSLRNGAKTHCKRGHAFDASNTLIDGKGRRLCRECRRQRERRHYAATS